ncbi:MAG: DUF1573 domain-containing protein [Chitinophagaceae bacterium]
MKRISLAILAIALTSASFAQSSLNQAKEATKKAVTVPSRKADDVVKFAEMKHDFGKIKQGTPVNYDFSFENVGAAPVVIESATASCGCTTPTWPKTPVTKAQKNKVSAGYNAANAGPFDKSIAVKVAGYDLPIELHITGEVLNSDDFTKYESSKPKKTGK